jgi:propanol-preferring alcohol dehydrogenase
MIILSGAMVITPSGMSGFYEPVDTVVALGAAVTDLDFKIGDRIAALGWRNTCGKCKMCMSPELNRYYYKAMRGFIGSNLPGAFQEYTVVDSRFSAKLPDRLGFVSAAPLTCAGATSWRAVIGSGAQRGDWVGVVGSGGGLGHLAGMFFIYSVR